MDFIGYFDGHKDEGLFGWSNVKLKEFDNLNFPSIHVYDLKFKNGKDKDVIYVPGKSFLAPVVCQYYHMIVDVLATYETLKSNYLDLKLIMCTKDEFHQYNNYIEKNIKFAKDILNIYNVDNIYDINNLNLHFEEVIFFPTLSMWFMDRIVPKAAQDLVIPPYTHQEGFVDRPFYLNYLKEKIEPMLKKRTKEKIYSARIPYDDNDPDFINFNMDEYINKTEPDRCYPDEPKIIKYFLDKGYKIVNLDKLGLLEQFEIFYNASHVAGIKGTNIFNAFWCEPNTEVIQISTQNWWGYQFEDYFGSFDLNVVNIAHSDARQIVPDNKEKRLDVNVIIDRLNQFFDFQLPS